jgi:hypothetical protein
MYYTYFNCHNLTGNPVCGDKVTNMFYTYFNCRNLTGSPVCGNNVTSMYYTYYNCTNLTGNLVCGANVTNMAYAYSHCNNISGIPVCGDNVTDMGCAYYNCRNLTGNPICGNNVTNMYYTYWNCYNLSAGSIHIRSNNISNAQACFSGKNNARRYDIYAHQGTATWNTLSYNNTSSLTGGNITWTNDTTTGGFYNTAYNIYVAPLINISFTIDGTTYQTEIGTSWY